MACLFFRVIKTNFIEKKSHFHTNYFDLAEFCSFDKSQCGMDFISMNKIYLMKEEPEKTIENKFQNCHSIGQQQKHTFFLFFIYCLSFLIFYYTKSE